MKHLLPTNNPRKLALVSALAVSMAIASTTSWAREANVKITAPTSAVATHNYDYEMNVFHPVQASNGMVATEQNLAS